MEDKTLQEAALRPIKEVGVPAVVKANTQGSTIGITFVHVKEKMAEAIESALKYDQDVLVEQFVAGTEVTASVLGNNSPEALPLIEITSVTGVYDYQSKYTPRMSDHIIPPRLPQDIQEKIKELAIKSFLSLGCRGLGRIDFIIRDNQPYALEVNTLPGMTASSLFPDVQIMQE